MQNLSFTLTTNAATAPPQPWLVEHGPAEYGTCVIERLDCESGFFIVRSLVQPNQPISEVVTHDGSERQLVVAFGLNGASEFCDKRGNRLEFREQCMTASIFQKGVGERKHAANHPVRQLRLVVTESALERYIGAERCQRLLGPDLRPHESFRQVAFSHNNASIHLRSLSDPALVHQQDGLSLRIHAFSLLSEQLRVLAPACATTGRLSARDLDKIAEVEAFMRAHLDKPLNNAYLCDKLGVSEYKLKAGFRQIYGTGPAQHLLEMRMHRAQELIAAGHQVAETAYRVGYQHPSNLSAAFTRFFGRTPKSAGGNRMNRILD